MNCRQSLLGKSHARINTGNVSAERFYKPGTSEVSKPEVVEEMYSSSMTPNKKVRILYIGSGVRKACILIPGLRDGSF